MNTDMEAMSQERRPERPEPIDGELYGPVEVGAFLGVKPQVIVNWIREDRAHPSATDALGRNRFTAGDVRALRESLGHVVRHRGVV